MQHNISSSLSNYPLEQLIITLCSQPFVSGEYTIILQLNALTPLRQSERSGWNVGTKLKNTMLTSLDATLLLCLHGSGSWLTNRLYKDETTLLIGENNLCLEKVMLMKFTNFPNIGFLCEVSSRYKFVLNQTYWKKRVFKACLNCLMIKISEI